MAVFLKGNKLRNLLSFLNRSRDDTVFSIIFRSSAHYSRLKLQLQIDMNNSEFHYTW